MAKLLCVLVFGLMMEAVGVVLLSRGLKELGDPQAWNFGALLGFAGRAVSTPRLVGGVALEAGFFGCLLFLMSRGDISFVWPLTSLGFVLTTLAARFILSETVVPLRWAGVALIVAGAGLITFTEKQKEKASAEATAAKAR